MVRRGKLARVTSITWREGGRGEEVSCVCVVRGCIMQSQGTNAVLF